MSRAEELMPETKRTPGSTARIPTGLRVTKETDANLKNLMQKTGLSKSHIIRTILEDAFREESE